MPDGEYIPGVGSGGPKNPNPNDPKDPKNDGNNGNGNGNGNNQGGNELKPSTELGGNNEGEILMP